MGEAAAEAAVSPTPITQNLGLGYPVHATFTIGETAYVFSANHRFPRQKTPRQPGSKTFLNHIERRPQLRTTLHSIYPCNPHRSLAKANLNPKFKTFLGPDKNTSSNS